jgi:hypothetical protein
VARAFSRIVFGKTPTVDDFRSLREQGRRLKDPVYERACAVARRFGFRAGSYVVKLVIPEDARLELRQTFDDPHHFTIYAEPEAAFALIEGEAVLIHGAPGV